MRTPRLLPAIFLSVLGLASRATAYETYDDWRARHFTPAQLAGPVGADASDANADGLPNLLHFAFGLSPWQSAPTGLTGGGVAPGGQNLVFYFPRRVAPGDIRYQPEFSRDLTDWWSGMGFFSQNARQSIDMDMEMVSVRAQSSLAIDGRQFFRLRVSRIDDSDGDGLDDAWEVEHFGDLAQGYYDDFDGDGVINGDAQWSGDDPRLGAAARDITPPDWTEDGTLAVTEETASGFTLSWPEATDDKPGTLRYLVYRNNQPLGSAITARSLAIPTSAIQGWQRWHVRPVDQSGNIGDSSTVLERELKPVVDAAFQTKSRQVAGVQGYWGVKGFAVEGIASTRHFSKKQESHGYWEEGHADFSPDPSHRHNRTDTNYVVTTIHLPDASFSTGITGTHQHAYRSVDGNGVAEDGVRQTGSWSLETGYSGQFWTTVNGVEGLPQPMSVAPTISHEGETLESTSETGQVWRRSWDYPGVPSPNYNKGEIGLSIELSDEVTEAMIEPALRARWPQLSELEWANGSVGASRAWSASRLGLSLAEGEYRVALSRHRGRSPLPRALAGGVLPKAARRRADSTASGQGLS